MDRVSGRFIMFSLVLIISMPILPAQGISNDGPPDWWDIDIDHILSLGGDGKEVVGFGPLLFDPTHWDDLRPLLPDDECQRMYVVHLGSPDGLSPLMSGDLRVVEVFSPLTFLVSGAVDVDGHEVLACFPYHPIMKVDPALFFYSRDMGGRGDVLLEVGLYDGPERGLVDLLGGPDKALLIPLDGMMIGTSHVADIYDIARMDGVSYVALRETFVVNNDVASGVLDVSKIRSLLGLDGTGQIVAVADTGLDTGLNSTMHPDLSGRVIRAYAYARTNNWSDPDIHINNSGVITYKGGHGTHVAGSVLGNGSASNGQYSGMAPNASLVMQSTMLSTGSLSIPAYFTLFNDAYNSGARIHTNSWSSGSNLGNYTSTRSWHIDNFVWGHNNMTILFSAGNNGPTLSTVSTQSSSKNVISVGASENYRPALSSSADNTSQMASFSSRGYVQNDGRIKPDVVAPGTYVLSTRSSLITDPWNHYWGWQSLYNSLNSRYAYGGGTSMSTPIVAGTAALIRQYYQDMEGQKDPSAALIKASIINGARPLSGNWSSIPNRNEGWGLVNATNSICTGESDAGSLRYVDNQTGISTGGTHSRKYVISSNGPDAIITLVWSDYPGSNTSSIKLVNDLDLTVTGPDGKQYNGNDMTSPYNSTIDRVNNVERVRIPDPEAGIYTVNVSGHSVSRGPQPYSIVMTGDFTGASARLSIVEKMISSNGGTATIELADSNLTGKGQYAVKAFTSTDTAGEMINLTELVQGGTATGFFRGTVNVTTASPGRGEVRVSGDEDLIVSYIDDYPLDKVNASVKVLLQPGIISITHDAEGKNLTYQDTVVATMRGTVGWAASLGVLGISSLEGLEAKDDGSGPDQAPGDGNYTVSFKIPNLLEGNFSIKGSITRPHLPPTEGYSSSFLYINTNIPRVVDNLTVSEVPSGNSLELSWDLPQDPNLQSLRIFRGVEDVEGSGIPGNLQHIHTTPDARSEFTDTGLEDKTTYFYRVRTYNVLGYLSAFSEIASGVPRDSSSPWIYITSPSAMQKVRGQIEINYTAEADTDHVLIEGANDHNEDGSADTPWVLLVNDTTPADPANWDTTSLPGTLEGDRTVLIRAVALDEVGNSNRSEIISGLRIDNDPVGSLMVTSPAVFGTNISVYNLVGETEPGGLVVAIRSLEVIGQGTVSPSGEFSIYVPLDEGENEIVVEAYDDIGNGPVRSDEALYVVFDDEPPQAVINGPVLGATTSSPVRFNGSGSVDIGPDSRYPGVVDHTWTASFRGETWNVYSSEFEMFTAAPGMLALSLKVEDFCGNHDSMELEMWVRDDIPPVLEAIADRTIKEDIITTFSPGKYSDNDPDLMASKTFTWYFTGPEEHTLKGASVQLLFDTPGVYRSRLELVDAAGNIAERTFNVTVLDLTPPAIETTSDIFVVRGSPVHLDASGVMDNDPLYPVGANFSWTLTELGSRYYGMSVEHIFNVLGQYNVTLSVRDASGNKAYGRFMLHVITDGTAPEVVASYPKEGERNVSLRSTLSVSFNEDIDRVTLYEGIFIKDDRGDETGFIIKGQDDPRSITIMPDLYPGRRYTLTLSRSITDITGSEIVPWSISFWTVKEMDLITIEGKKPAGGTSTFALYPGDELNLTFSDRIGDDVWIGFQGPDGEMGYFDHVIGGDGTIMTVMMPGDLLAGTYVLDLNNVSSFHGLDLEWDGTIMLYVSILPDDGENNERSYSRIIIAVAVLLFFILFALVFVFRKKRPAEDNRDSRGPPLGSEHILDHERHRLHPGHHEQTASSQGSLEKRVVNPDEKMP